MEQVTCSGILELIAACQTSTSPLGAVSSISESLLLLHSNLYLCVIHTIRLFYYALL